MKKLFVNFVTYKAFIDLMNKFKNYFTLWERDKSEKFCNLSFLTEIC